MTTLAWTRRRCQSEAPRMRPSGLPWVFAAELIGAGLGFLALVIQARRLGPEAFARVEYASAVAAWLLVLVRGGVDVIVYRESARRPRLIARFANLLLGIRLAAAVLGYGVVLGFAWKAGAKGGPSIAIAGLVLFASAVHSDVGLRAWGLLRWIALAQGFRSIGVLMFVVWLVRIEGDGRLACLGLVSAEVLASLVTLVPHVQVWGFLRPRFRARAWRVLIHRGAIAGASRFGRVTLYGLDMLVLGAIMEADLGPYAAARRIVFALVALGIVLPAALGPQIARAWSCGRTTARALVSEALEGLVTLAIPATLGLALTADRWMPLLFGSGYRDGGPWLALLVARLPFLLVASFAQAVLVACRKEKASLQYVIFMLGTASVLIPIGLTSQGAWGVGCAILATEVVGAVVGLRMMARLELVGDGMVGYRAIAGGCVGLFAACRLTQDAPLLFVCASGAGAYGLMWRLLRGRRVR